MVREISEAQIEINGPQTNTIGFTMKFHIYNTHRYEYTILPEAKPQYEL